MAFPVILVNNTGGSDTQASGAGPATALFGTTDASFATATVTLTAGTDLSGVSTTGSDVLYLLTSTGVRFFKITAKAGSGGATPTVDVTPNPAGTSTGRTWAIGGKRASCFSASSLLLFNNGSASGDAMPGWAIEMQSGHTETVASQVDMYRAGDQTSGAIILRGTSGAGTKPIITFSINALCIAQRASYWQFTDFELQNTNGTKTASTAFWPNTTADNIIYSGLKIADSTNKFWKAIPITNGCIIKNCDIGNCASDGIFPGTFNGCFIAGNYVHANGGIGINCSTADWLRTVIVNNIIVGNTSHGIVFDASGTNTNRAGTIGRNTIDSNGGDGIRSAQATVAIGCTQIFNNILSNNTGYGLNFTSGTVTAIWLASFGAFLDSNDSYNNTSGASNPASISTNNPNLNPTFTGGGNYTVGNTSLKNTAFPATLPASSGTNYDYPGTVTPNSSGSAGMLYIPNLDGV